MDTIPQGTSASSQDKHRTPIYVEGAGDISGGFAGNITLAHDIVRTLFTKGGANDLAQYLLQSGQNGNVRDSLISAGAQGRMIASERLLQETSASPWLREKVVAALVFTGNDELSMIASTIHSVDASTRAIANRAIWDVTTAGLTPLEWGTAAYRIAANDERTAENYIIVALPVVGHTAKYVAKGGIKVFGTIAADRGVVADGLIYRRIDTTGKIEPYFGQTTVGNQLAREAAHNRAFPNSDFRYFTVDKGLQRGTALDIAEHNAIQDFTGGVAARRSSAVSNLRDPVGAARRPALGLPEPR